MASPVGMESGADSRREEIFGQIAACDCRKQDGRQSERGLHGASYHVSRRRKYVICFVCLRPCAKPSITHELERLYYNPSCPGQLQPSLL